MSRELTEVDPVVRDEVLTHYTNTTPPSCKCCRTNTPEFLNVLPVRLDSDGMQIMRSGDAPMAASRWEWFKRMQFPEGYVVFCSNCVAAHQIGVCPYNRA